MHGDRETYSSEQEHNATLHLLDVDPGFYQNFSFYDEPNEILELTTLASSGIFVAGVFFNVTAFGVLSSAVFHKMSFTVHMKFICFYNIAVLCLGMIRHQSFMMDVPGHAKPARRHLLCLQVLWFFHVLENTRSISIALLLYNRIRAQRQVDSHHKSTMALRLPVLMNTASFLLMVMPVSTYVSHYHIMTTHFNRTECVFAFLKPFNLEVPTDVVLSNSTIVEEGLIALLLLVLIMEIGLKHWRQKKAYARQRDIAKDSSSEQLMTRLSNLRFSIASTLSIPQENTGNSRKRYGNASKSQEAQEPEKRTHSPMPKERNDAVEQWQSDIVKPAVSNKELSVYFAEHRVSSVDKEDQERETAGRDTLIFAASPMSDSLSDSPDITAYNLMKGDKRREALRARDNGATRMSVAMVTLHILTAVPKRVQHSSLLATYIPGIASPSFPVLALMDMIMFTYQAIMFIVICAIWKLYRKEAYKLLFETDDGGISDISFPYTSIVISRLLRHDEEGATSEYLSTKRRDIGIHRLPKWVKTLDKNSSITEPLAMQYTMAINEDVSSETTRRRSLIHNDKLSADNQISTGDCASVKDQKYNRDQMQDQFSMKSQRSTKGQIFEQTMRLQRATKDQHFYQALKIQRATKDQLFDQAMKIEKSTSDKIYDQTSLKSQKSSQYKPSSKEEIMASDQINASVKTSSPDNQIPIKDPKVMRVASRGGLAPGKEAETISISSKATSRAM